MLAFPFLGFFLLLSAPPLCWGTLTVQRGVPTTLCVRRGVPSKFSRGGGKGWGRTQVGCKEGMACSLEERKRLNAAFDKSNPACKLDVDRDGLISSKDVVRVTLKAIAYNRLSSIVDNPYLGLVSASVICVGALYEALEALSEEGINKSAIGLAILALGHFMHYFRELLREIIELDEAFDQPKSSEDAAKIN
ncbi:hypothetical protein AAMO2058_000478500 [Amorphochlora amoebiformis]